MSNSARRQSKSDSETSSTEGSTVNSSPGSFDWCSSVGPLNWADEVEAELLCGEDMPTVVIQAPDCIASTGSSPELAKVRRGPKSPKKEAGRATAAVPNAGQRPTYAWADGCAGAVLQLLQEYGSSRPPSNLGWEALQRIWNVGPQNLDHAVLACLNSKPPRCQEHILLSFAAIDLSNVKNLSAYLNCLVKEHDTTRQVCLYFLAGLCTEGKGCTWVHPVNTPGWNVLQETWQLTYKDLDYTVLNFLCKKAPEEQDNILASFAAMDLRGILNLSAYLSSMIQKHGPPHQHPGFNSKKADGRRFHPGRHAVGYHGSMSPALTPEAPVQEPVGPELGTPGGSPPYYPPAFMQHPGLGPHPLPPYPYMMRPYESFMAGDGIYGADAY